MTSLLPLFIVTLTISYLWYWFTNGRFRTAVRTTPLFSAGKKKKKSKPGEMWVQVFETDSREEAQAIQMRLEEENISVTIFEQAKKGISGSTPAGIGIVVPKEQSSYAQHLIFRYLEHLDGESESKSSA